VEAQPIEQRPQQRRGARGIQLPRQLSALLARGDPARDPVAKLREHVTHRRADLVVPGGPRHGLDREQGEGLDDVPRVESADDLAGRAGNARGVGQGGAGLAERLAEGDLERSPEEAFLRREVVVDQALVRRGALRDLAGRDRVPTNLGDEVGRRFDQAAASPLTARRREVVLGFPWLVE
jgi:hypothetical protein